jgi:hypothetical protein
MARAFSEPCRSCRNSRLPESGPRPGFRSSSRDGTSGSTWHLLRLRRGPRESRRDSRRIPLRPIEWRARLGVQSSQVGNRHGGHIPLQIDLDLQEQPDPHSRFPGRGWVSRFLKSPRDGDGLRPLQNRVTDACRTREWRRRLLGKNRADANGRGKQEQHPGPDSLLGTCHSILDEQERRYGRSFNWRLIPPRGLCQGRLARFGFHRVACGRVASNFGTASGSADGMDRDVADHVPPAIQQ